ncbi:MAG: ABC transporter permease subunit [Solirubrobacteraceae bacterium]
MAMGTLTDAISFIGRNGVDQPGEPTLVHLTLKHLELSGVALLVALLIAVPLGVWLGHLHRGSFVAFNVSYIGRALPSLAVIAIGIPFLGLGFRNVVVALIVLAIPPMLTNAYVAVAGVEPEVVDAARGMGMREREILLRVELPLALPILFTGIRISAVFVVATATITSLAGYSGSLGDIIANQASYRFSGVLGAAICVALLALLVDGTFALAQRLVTPRGLRLRGRERDPAPGRLEALPELS